MPIRGSGARPDRRILFNHEWTRIYSPAFCTCLAPQTGGPLITPANSGKPRMDWERNPCQSYEIPIPIRGFPEFAGFFRPSSFPPVSFYAENLATVSYPLKLVRTLRLLRPFAGHKAQPSLTKLHAARIADSELGPAKGRRRRRVREALLGPTGQRLFFRSVRSDGIGCAVRAKHILKVDGLLVPPPRVARSS